MGNKRKDELLTKASDLLNRWTESVIMMAAELFIINPWHEIFKGNYFEQNTKILILHRVREMLNYCNIKRVVIEKDDGTVYDHSPANIEKLVKKFEDQAKNPKI